MGKSRKAYADEKLKEAYRTCSASLIKYCRVRLGDAADYTDDCVQEAFCVFYRKLLAGEEIEKPGAFLYRTADNMVKRAKSEYIKHAQRTAILESAEHVQTFIFEENADNIDYDAVKDILISDLSKDEQLLYQQKYIEKLSLKEIGTALGIPPSAVANRTSRLRTKIKKLTKEIIEQEQKGGS